MLARAIRRPHSMQAETGRRLPHRHRPRSAPHDSRARREPVGDVLECGIEHLGAQRHEILAYTARLFRPRPAVGMRKTKGETID